MNYTHYVFTTIGWHIYAEPQIPYKTIIDIQKHIIVVNSCLITENIIDYAISIIISTISLRYGRIGTIRI